MSKKTPEQLVAARIRQKRWEEKHPDARKVYRETHKDAIKSHDAMYYAANKDVILAKQQAYNEAHREERQQKSREYLTANREAINARRRARYAADPHKINERNKASYQKHRDKRDETNRKWAEEHPEAIQQIKKRYKVVHREEILEQARMYTAKHRQDPAVQLREQQWRKEHPEYNRASAKRRRGRKKNAPISDLTAQQWETIKIHYGHRCVYCGRKMKRLTQDHITPLSKGGNHTASNIVPACLSCNVKKSNKEVLVPVQPLLLI